MVIALPNLRSSKHQKEYETKIVTRTPSSGISNPNFHNRLKNLGRSSWKWQQPPSSGGFFACKLPKCVFQKQASTFDVAMMTKDGRRWFKKFLVLKVQCHDIQRFFALFVARTINANVGDCSRKCRGHRTMMHESSVSHANNFTTQAESSKYRFPRPCLVAAIIIGSAEALRILCLRYFRCVREREIQTDRDRESETEVTSPLSR